MENKVFISPCSDYEIENIDKAYEEILINSHLLDFAKEGLKVGIKVNLVSALKPEKAATTNPYLVKELCKLLVDRGCIVTVGDSPGGLYNEHTLRNVYNQTGMNIVTEVGAKLNNNFDQCVLDIDGEVVKKLDATSWLNEQDVIINYSKIKSHGMMTFSGSVKNMFGCVPGILKPEYHYRYPNYDDFAGMLIDINEHFKCVLNLMDAVIGMEGNGPTAGTPRFVGLLMASISPYAIDLVATHLIGLKQEDVKTIGVAKKRGLSIDSYNDLELNMDIESYCIPDYKNILPGKDMEFVSDKGPIRRLARKVVSNILTVRPLVENKKECIGCKKCFNICPAKAITMKNNVPSIDKKKCIRCFCCQEFCPVGAMKVHKKKIVKLLTKNKGDK